MVKGGMRERTEGGGDWEKGERGKREKGKERALNVFLGSADSF